LLQEPVADVEMVDGVYGRWWILQSVDGKGPTVFLGKYVGN